MARLTETSKFFETAEAKGWSVTYDENCGRSVETGIVTLSKQDVVIKVETRASVSVEGLMFEDAKSTYSTLSDTMIALNALSV